MGKKKKKKCITAFRFSINATSYYHNEFTSSYIYTETLATFCFVIIFSALILSTLEYKMEFRFFFINHTVLPLTTNNNNGDECEDRI